MLFGAPGHQASIGKITSSAGRPKNVTGSQRTVQRTSTDHRAAGCAELSLRATIK
jgi:hypothetical protein